MDIKNTNFDLKQTADSGQCFRMNQTGDNQYGLIAYGKYLNLIRMDEDTVRLGCGEEEYHQIWEGYFDLVYDYGSIIQSLLSGEDRFLSQAAAYGQGIRILRQEPFETMISFIISQNKNIPSIKNCIERLCERFGDYIDCKERPGGGYYTFPKAEILAGAEAGELRKLKLGYRDEYIIKASQAVADGSIDLDELSRCSYEKAFMKLKGIRGIGDKVANCIALYGLHHIEAFPVDVWINKAIKEFYNGSFDSGKYQGYAGIVQQYMFYYIRHLYAKGKGD